MKLIARLRFRLFDPDGAGIDVSPTLHTLEDKNETENFYYDLKPGCYEVDIEGHFLQYNFMELTFWMIK